MKEPIEPGYWWGFSLDSNGIPMQMKPDIFFITSDNDVLSIGWDLSVPYTAENYQMIKRVEFTTVSTLPRDGYYSTPNGYADAMDAMKTANTAAASYKPVTG